MRHLLWASLLAAAGGSIAAWPSVQPARFDVVIRNGCVMDGSGNPWIRADVGIRAGRIAAVGLLPEATAATFIDAANRLDDPGVH